MSPIRSIILFITAIFSLAVFAADVTYGYVARVTLNRVAPSPPEPSTGIVALSPAGTYYQFYYYNGSIRSESSVLSTLGYTLNHDVDGSSISSPNYQYRYFTVVGGLRQYAVRSSSPTNSIGVLGSPHSLGPIYDSSAGMPFNVNDYGNISSVNPSFDASSISPLQGDLQFDGSSVDQYLYYSSDGMPLYGDSPAVYGDGKYVWDYSDGSWDLTSAALAPPSDGVDLTPVVNAIETQGGLTREQLVQLLGSAGQSWVYDCKLSLSQLYSLASSQGLVTRPQIDLSGIQSSLDTIAGHVPPDISGLNKETTQAGIKSRLDTWSPYIVAQAQNVSTMRSTQNSMNTRLSNIETVLASWNSDNSPSFSSPDFGEDTPDDDIPFDVSGFNSSVSQSLGQLVSWGDSGAPVLFPDVFSGLLSSMIGSIPSVGSDPVMFSFDVDLPYLGHIQKTWSFADWPFIGLFRTFILWVLYVFFGIAMFKLLHSTLI